MGYILDRDPGGFDQLIGSATLFLTGLKEMCIPAELFLFPIDLGSGPVISNFDVETAKGEIASKRFEALVEWFRNL